MQGGIIWQVLRREYIKSIFKILTSMINLTWAVTDNKASPVI